MTKAVTIDDSEPGSWRGALALREPGGRTACAACGQSVCEHPDAVWDGRVPPPGGTR